MSRFAQGKYAIANPEKYIGKKTPTYRSSWEWHFMKFCDNTPAIQKWASEAISIPYRCPITGKQTIYVPDFFIQYVDKILESQYFVSTSPYFATFIICCIFAATSHTLRWGPVCLHQRPEFLEAVSSTSLIHLLQWCRIF